MGRHGQAAPGPGYLADESAAWSRTWPSRRQAPCWSKAPAGGWKTQLGPLIARPTECPLEPRYEGLDEAKALYECDYCKQLLRIQAESGLEAEPATGPAAPGGGAQGAGGDRSSGEAEARPER